MYCARYSINHSNTPNKNHTICTNYQHTPAHRNVNNCYDADLRLGQSTEVRWYCREPSHFYQGLWVVHWWHGPACRWLYQRYHLLLVSYPAFWTRTYHAIISRLPDPASFYLPCLFPFVCPLSVSPCFWSSSYTYNWLYLISIPDSFLSSFC